MLFKKALMLSFLSSLTRLDKVVMCSLYVIRIAVFQQGSRRQHVANKVVGVRLATPGPMESKPTGI